MLPLDEEEKQDHGLKEEVRLKEEPDMVVQSDMLPMIPESSRLEETNRSKVFEDSDQSTFRMINFGGNKRNASHTKSKSHTANIDFYS